MLSLAMLTISAPAGLESAAEVEVRGCRHGDLSVTDAAGAFTTEAVEGTTCYPMAFLDREGVFARSNAPQY